MKGIRRERFKKENAAVSWFSDSRKCQMRQKAPFFPGDVFRFRHVLNKSLKFFKKNHISPDPKTKNARIP
jgi:hypothetical protein